jgi:hypothetical protein
MGLRPLSTPKSAKTNFQKYPGHPGPAAETLGLIPVQIPDHPGPGEEVSRSGLHQSDPGCADLLLRFHNCEVWPCARLGRERTPVVASDQVPRMAVKSLPAQGQRPELDLARRLLSIDPRPML